MSTTPSNFDPRAYTPPAANDYLLAGRYRLLEKIGEGGAAEVFRAVDERLERVVALKLLRVQYVRDETWRRRFEIEAKAAAGLSHPNIVDIYDVGEGPDGTLFIAMQYVQGPTLRDVLSKRGRLVPSEVIYLARQLCGALSVAHRNGLVHRDVKPQNILIDSHGNARLTDFGIVKALSGQALTQSGVTFGTAAYLSPEQATGQRVGPASDLYALGCVMYEMLSGSPPFTGDNPTTIAYKQVWEQPRPLHEWVPEVPPSLESIVMRCLHKDPAGRHPSAEELARDLERVGVPYSQPTQQVAVGAPSQPFAAGSQGPTTPSRPAPPVYTVPPAVAAPVHSGPVSHVAPVPPVRVQTTGMYASQAIPATGHLPGGAAVPYATYPPGGVQVLNVPQRRRIAWWPLVAIVALLGVGLLGFAVLQGRLFQRDDEANSPFVPQPTEVAGAQGLELSPTPLIEVAPLVASATPSPTEVPVLPTDTAEPVPTDTPVPPTEAPPTETATPEPLPTDTPVPPPPPTDTPLPPPPTDTPEPLPTDTPVPLLPTETPAPPPPPPPLPTDTPPLPEPTPESTPGPTPVVSELEQVVDEVIAGNPKAVAAYLDGKRTALLELLQDFRDRARGRIKFNISEVRDVFVRKLEELRGKLT